MDRPLLESAIRRLAEEFARRNWKYLDVPTGSRKEKTYQWPGQPDEKIMICVHRGPDIREMFHRQDFFLALDHQVFVHCHQRFEAGEGLR